MSEYRNFVQDFPKRCSKLLDRYEKTSRFAGLEVTMMIAIAAAGFTIPYERLRSNHPFEDKKRYEKSAEMLEQLKKERFLSSRLTIGTDRTWCFGRLASHQGNPDSWPEMHFPTPLKEKQKTSDVLYHLRNALAHGNIYTLKNPIQTIIFLSKKDKNSNIFNYLNVSPEDFCRFLHNWFNFIAQLDLPEGMVTGTIIDNENVMDVVNA